MKSVKVQLVDAGTGNLQSVFNILQYLGAEIKVVQSAGEFKTGFKTILPGVGAFRHFMEGLIQKELKNSILNTAASGNPLLGICVGMQALFDFSEEMGDTPGLGVIPGTVRRFPDGLDIKVPHTGWNTISHNEFSPLLQGIKSGSYFYFNHSYYCQPSNDTFSLSKTDYIKPFSSGVEKGNIFGVQFHPEKSQRLGQQLIQNFLNL